MTHCKGRPPQPPLKCSLPIKPPQPTQLFDLCTCKGQNQDYYFEILFYILFRFFCLNILLEVWGIPSVQGSGSCPDRGRQCVCVCKSCLTFIVYGLTHTHPTSPPVRAASQCGCSVCSSLVCLHTCCLTAAEAAASPKRLCVCLLTAALLLLGI